MSNCSQLLWLLKPNTKNTWFDGAPTRETHTNIYIGGLPYIPHIGDIDHIRHQNNQNVDLLGIGVICRCRCPSPYNHRIMKLNIYILRMQNGYHMGARLGRAHNLLGYHSNIFHEMRIRGRKLNRINQKAIYFILSFLCFFLVSGH